MFLRCLVFSGKDGSQRNYLQAIQTYRENGRVRQKIIANLGRLDELIASGTLEKLSEALSRYVEKGEEVVKIRSQDGKMNSRFKKCEIFLIGVRYHKHRISR